MKTKLAVFATLIMAVSSASRADPDLTLLKGNGTLQFRGKSSHVDTVIYGASNGTVVFQVPTGHFAVGFEGSEDMQPSANQYILKVDRIYNGRPGAPDNSRTDAEGSCELDVSDDGEIVRSMNCHARTSFGNVSLSFHGRRAH